MSQKYKALKNAKITLICILISAAIYIGLTVQVLMYIALAVGVLIESIRLDKTRMELKK